jgi:hypothetical protein
MTLMIAWTVGLHAAHAGDEASAVVKDGQAQAVIVIGQQASATDVHAAEQLASLIQQITGAQLPIISDEEPADPGLTLIAIGRAETNELVKACIESGSVALSADDPGLDGYVIKTLASPEGQSVLLLGGSRDRGTLYAVYELLRHTANVGYFWDANRIPTSSDFIVPPIDIRERPFFRDRLNLHPLGGYGGNWHAHSVDNWKRGIDWAAQNRLNQLLLTGDPAPPIFMQIVRARLSGQPDPVATEADRKDIDFYRQVFAYAAKADIELLSCLAIAPIADEQIQQAHRDARYNQASWLDFTSPVRYIYPGDPLFKAFYRTTAEVWRELFPESSHTYYAGGPHSETKFHDITPEEEDVILIDSNKVHLEGVLEADPQAVFQVSAWGFVFDPHGFWNDRRTKLFLDAMRSDRYIIWDIACDLSMVYKSPRINYWQGNPWMFCILHSFGGCDELHGDVAGTLKMAQDVATDPKAGNCVGFGQTPELMGPSVLFYDFLNQIAWDPRPITVEGYLLDFANRRYGPQVGPQMMPHLRAMAETVYSDKGSSRSLHEHRPDLGNWAPRWDLSWGKLSPPQALQTAKVLAGFTQALLEHEDTLGHEQPYRNDLIDYTDQALTELANIRRMTLDQAFMDGDQQRFESEVIYMNQMLDEIERVLSARSEYRVLDVFQRHGGDIAHWPDAGRGLRDGQLTFAKSIPGLIDYQARGLYELVKFHNRPRIDAYVDYLRSQMAAGETTADSEALITRYVALEHHWVDEGFDPAEAPPFDGTEAEACRQALAAAHPIMELPWQREDVIPPGLTDVTNIAIDHCVAASTTLPGFNLNSVADGDVSWGTGWASQGLAPGQTVPPQWLLFDFGQPREVIAIQYFIESSPVGARAKRYCRDYLVEISDDGENWRPVKQGSFAAEETAFDPAHPLTKSTSATPKHSLPLIEFDAPVNARYLRFHMLNSHAGNIILVGELKIWGR